MRAHPDQPATTQPRRRGEAPAFAQHHVPAGSTAERMRVVSREAGQLRAHASQLLRLRRDELVAAVRRAFWRVAAAMLMTVIGVTAVITATVMTLQGVAHWVASWSATGAQLGGLVVGIVVLLLFLAAMVWGVRDHGQTRRAARRAAAQADLVKTSRRLVRVVGLVPGMLTATTLGFVSTRLLRRRSVRRAALFGIGMMRKGLGPVARQSPQ